MVAELQEVFDLSHQDSEKLEQIQRSAARKIGD